MMMTCCLNQAKRIIEKFDGVLFGVAPEILVQNTHTKIRELLASDAARLFLEQDSQESTANRGDGDVFVRRIVEAVSPILPITLRDKSLDGGYLRTALHLLTAAEILFSQYETDVRIGANPAGVVGMCNSLHSEIKRSTHFGEPLRVSRDFPKELSSLYQT